MSRHDQKIQKRLERLVAGAAETVEMESAGPYTLTRCRKFKGINVRGANGIPPVYDDIALNPEFNVAAVFIEGMAALADIHNGSLLTDFEYDMIEFAPSGHSIILYREGLKGLFDVVARKVSLQPGYREITRNSGQRYAWTYSPADGYEYFDSETGRRIPLGHSIEECFDESHGNIFVLRGGNVEMLNSDGLTDLYGYRKLLATLRGRITLYNSARGITVTADIYGHIL